MIIFKKAKDLQLYLEGVKHKNFPTGFVPTMGALHKGHLSLIAQSKKNTKLTICSIFVNPVQFNNVEDFKKYPTVIEKDILLLEESGCDILFMPSEEEVYPDAASRNKHFELGNLDKILEGKFRPGHFQGVCLVVDRLLNIVNPNFLFLGQKDFQQCLVIKKLISIGHKKTEVIICPILREKNGLAMSSRNLRLNEDERKTASALYKTLTSVKKNLHNGNFQKLKANAIIKLEKKGFKVDYLELATRQHLKLVDDNTESQNFLLLIAAFLNNVRLIDNVFVKE